MTFEDFKATYPWIFRGQQITYDARSYTEATSTHPGREILSHFVDITVNSKTLKGRLQVAVTIPAEDASDFISALEKAVDSVY